MKNNILDKNLLQNRLIQAKNEGLNLYSILIDPDKHNLEEIPNKCKAILNENPDLILVGGSLLNNIFIDNFITELKQHLNLPIYLFPGSPIQFSSSADGLLFLSLISGRNADLLIGRHIEIAPTLINSNLEVLPTGYMLVNGGLPTSASYISNTQPIPAHKWDIALATAQAGQLLGLKAIYMDAGSGAENPIPLKTIERVARGIDIPLIIGGGIRTKAQRQAVYDAGAQMVVMGTVFE